MAQRHAIVLRKLIGILGMNEEVLAGCILVGKASRKVERAGCGVLFVWFT